MSDVLRAVAEWAPDPTDKPKTQTRDPDDDYLLALARSADVDVLVSGDRDLTDLADTEPSIETPAEFSRRLEDRSTAPRAECYSRISIHGVSIARSTPVAPAFVTRGWRLSVAAAIRVMRRSAPRTVGTSRSLKRRGSGERPTRHKPPVGGGTLFWPLGRHLPSREERLGRHEHVTEVAFSDRGLRSPAAQRAPSRMLWVSIARARCPPCNTRCARRAATNATSRYS